MNRFFRKSFLLILTVDVLLLILAWMGAFTLRFNFDIPESSKNLIFQTLPLVVPLKIIIFFFFNLYKGMWRYTGITDLYNILKSSIISSLVVFFLLFFSFDFTGFARSIFIIDFVLTVFFISGHRIGVRLYFWIGPKENSVQINPVNVAKILFGLHPWENNQKRLLIIGAGDSGGKKISRDQ